MKNNKLNLILFLAVTFLYFSCQRDDDSFEPNLLESGITLKNGELHFSSVEGYENMIADGMLTSRNLEEKLGGAYTSFSSLYKKIAQSDLQNELKTAVFGFDQENEFPILNILNDQEMVTIGEWTFKIDLIHELVGVVNANDLATRMSLKNKNYNDHNIQWYGVEDDVILLLEEGKKGTLNFDTVQERIKQNNISSDKTLAKVTAICQLDTENDSATNPLKDKKIVYSEAKCGTGNTYTVQVPVYDNQGNFLYYRPETRIDCKRWLADAKHVYQKAGVYFSLQSKIKYRGNVDCTSSFPTAVSTQLTASVNYYYERRRRFKKNEKKSGSPRKSAYSNELNIRSYEGSRSLKKYTLNSTFTYQRKDNCASFCNLGSNTVTIRMPQIKK